MDRYTVLLARYRSWLNGRGSSLSAAELESLMGHEKRTQSLSEFGIWVCGVVIVITLALRRYLPEGSVVTAGIGMLGIGGSMFILMICWLPSRGLIARISRELEIKSSQNAVGRIIVDEAAADREKEGEW